MQNYTTSYIVCRLPIKTVLGGKKKKLVNLKQMYCEKAGLKNGYTVHLTIGTS